MSGNSVTQKEDELFDILVDYYKRTGIEKEEALAIALLIRGDDNAQEMIDYLHSNPDIDFTYLLEKAVEIYRRN